MGTRDERWGLEWNVNRHRRRASNANANAARISMDEASASVSGDEWRSCDTFDERDGTERRWRRITDNIKSSINSRRGGARDEGDPSSTRREKKIF